MRLFPCVGLSSFRVYNAHQAKLTAQKEISLAFYRCRYIAMISRQRAFNKSMVDPDTQVIFLDEAYSKILDPDDWKLIIPTGLSANITFSDHYTNW